MRWRKGGQCCLETVLSQVTIPAGRDTPCQSTKRTVKLRFYVWFHCRLPPWWNAKKPLTSITECSTPLTRNGAVVDRNCIPGEIRFAGDRKRSWYCSHLVWVWYNGRLPPFLNWKSCQLQCPNSRQCWHKTVRSWVKIIGRSKYVLLGTKMNRKPATLQMRNFILDCNHDEMWKAPDCSKQLFDNVNPKRCFHGSDPSLMGYFLLNVEESWNCSLA